MPFCPHCQSTFSHSGQPDRCPICEAALDISGTDKQESNEQATTEPDLAIPGDDVADMNDSADILETYIQTTWGDHINGEAADVDASLKAGAVDEYDPEATLVIPLRNFGQMDDNDNVTNHDLNDYDLQKVLGEGGVGVVYAARQSSIDRTVAIKMLKPHLSHDAKQQSRFLAEAAVTGEMEHPNIVPIYELGRNAEGSLFYAMKRVQGTPWDEVIAEKTEAENIEILMKVCDAVAFAHSHKRAIIHRDLKPGNVMLGEFGEVLVMDWGLAISTTQRTQEDDDPTKNILAGTPSYMAPEMAKGPLGKIGTKSDIYLLGGILFKMLTGKTPHTGHNQLTCLMNAARNDLATTPVTGELIEIARKAMATHPDDRYATVTSFQNAIREYQSHLASNIATDLATHSLQVGREKSDYTAFSKAMFGFQQALDGWPENRLAAEGYDQAVLAYAACAAAKGDYDLGLTLLRSDDKRTAKRSSEKDRGDLQKQLLAGKAESDSRQQRIRRLKQVAAILCAMIAIVVSVALFVVSNQLHKAELAEKKERKAKEEAISAKVTAELATKREELAKEKAMIQERGKEVALAKANIALAEAAWRDGNATAMRKYLEDCPVDLRDSSWKYFHQKLNSRITTISRNGRYGHDFVKYWPGDDTHEPCFVSNNRNGNLLFYDCVTGEWVRDLKLSEGSRFYAFSPDGQFVASSGRQLRVHNARNGEELAEFQLPSGSTNNLSFTFDGKYIVCKGNNPRDVHFVDWKTSEVVWTMAANSAVRSSAIGQFAVDPTGQFVAVHFLSPTQEVWILNAKTGERVRSMAPGNGFLWSLKFSADGTLLAGGDIQGYATVWQVEQGNVRLRIRAGAAQLRELAFTPQNHLITMASETGAAQSRQRLRLWELANGTELSSKLDVPFNGSFAFAPKTMHVFCSGKEATLWQFPLVTPRFQWESQLSNPVGFLGEYYLFAGAEGLRTYALHDLQAEKSKQRPWSISDSLSREKAFVNFDHSAAMVTINSAANGGASKNLRLIRLVDNRPGEPESIADHLHSDRIAFAAQKSEFVSFGRFLSGNTSQLKLRASTLGLENSLWEFDPHTNKCNSLTYLNNDAQVLGLFPSPEAGKPTQNNSKQTKSILYVLDAQTGTKIKSISFADEQISMVANRSGNRVAISGQDKQISIYRASQFVSEEKPPTSDPPRLQPFLQFRAHDSTVTALAWHPSSPIIASASNDLSIKLWNAESGELLKTILGPVRTPRSLAFNATGTLLAASSNDNEVRVWEIDAQNLLSPQPSREKTEN